MNETKKIKSIVKKGQKKLHDLTPADWLDRIIVRVNAWKWKKNHRFWFSFSVCIVYIHAANLHRYGTFIHCLSVSATEIMNFKQQLKSVCTTTGEGEGGSMDQITIAQNCNWFITRSSSLFVYILCALVPHWPYKQAHYVK